LEGRTRTELLPGVFLTQIRTQKFKTGFLSATLLRPLSKEEASKNALLPRVLRRGTVEHPDMEKLAAVLDELFGANIEVRIRRLGEVHCVGFVSSFIDDIYAGRDLLDGVASLLGKLLLNPVTRGGRFLPEYVESERNKLLDRIRSQMNDKRYYSLLRMNQIMCAGEPFGVDRLGTESAAAAITGSSLYKHYTDVLAHSSLEIFYCGSADPKQVELSVTAALAGLPGGEKEPVKTRQGFAPEKTREKTETMDVSQCNLAIGFRTNCVAGEEAYPALLLANAIFGGSVSSKLFMNVREKLSLCYYASSALERHKGLMLVSAGIEKTNIDKAKNEIFAQLQALCDGDISDDELEGSRRELLSGLSSVSDSQAALEDYWLAQTIAGTDMAPEQFAEKLAAVTKEQIVEAAKRIKPDTVYILKGADA
jgi:predicted Zn-dependent peptidase